ncbi:hypothetical protein GCM10009720_29860 [Yaniella flava]|uniref:HTH luxR-type domain-containing protein n=1 Tax=Yaniella flava TaxID=287930 RepID=A0ABP5GKR1_9MICC
MSNPIKPETDSHPAKDELAHFVAEIEDAISREDWAFAATLIEENTAAAWFGMQPPRTMEIVSLLASKIPSHGSLLHAGYRLLTAASAGQFDVHEYLSTVDTNNAEEMFLLSMLRMSDFRVHGRTIEALEQGETANDYHGKMHPTVDANDGWALQTSVQIGISAMLAGDFTRALSALTQAQMHAAVPKYAFLTRDALVKSALLHACFGNAATARSFLDRATRIPRTSSWAEAHIDTHRDFAEILTSIDDYDEAIERLDTISLHDIGEMWPFYIVAVQRVLVSAGYLDELDHRLEVFDSMPLPRVDGNGFAGSVIPVKRAMLAMEAGRGADAQELLVRADHNLPYTQIIEAAGHLYAGRTQQAIQLATQLRSQTRGFRVLDLRRKSVLAAAQNQAGETSQCVETLERVADIPRGLGDEEIRLFSPETRELAAKHVPSWPKDPGGASTFLTGLPKPGRGLTEREVELMAEVAKGHTRAEIAERLFVSLNTVKTQLKSAYRKLEVSSADDAVLAAQRRGLI